MINDDTADRLYAELEVLEDVLNGEWSAVRCTLLVLTGTSHRDFHDIGNLDDFVQYQLNKMAEDANPTE